MDFYTAQGEGIRISSARCLGPLASRPKNGAEGMEALASPTFCWEGLGRRSLTDGGSLTRRASRGGGRRGMKDNVLSQEPGVLHFHPALLITECVISHTSLDLSFKVRTMHIRNMRPFLWFSNFT